MRIETNKELLMRKIKSRRPYEETERLPYIIHYIHSEDYIHSIKVDLTGVEIYEVGETLKSKRKITPVEKALEVSYYNVILTDDDYGFISEINDIKSGLCIELYEESRKLFH